jgi:hypothetical protein
MGSMRTLALLWFNDFNKLGPTNSGCRRLLCPNRLNRIDGPCLLAGGQAPLVNIVSCV